MFTPSRFSSNPSESDVPTISSLLRSLLPLPTLAFILLTGFSLPGWSKGESVIVEQKDHRFSELFIKLNNDSILKFVNLDDVKHHLLFSHKGQSELMNELEPGKTQEVTFSHSGIYDVQCKNHPEMKLTIFIPHVVNLTNPELISTF